MNSEATQLHTPGLSSDVGRDAFGSEVYALLTIGGEEAVEPLSRYVQDRDPMLVHMIVVELGRIGTATAIEPLSVALSNSNLAVRRAAVAALDRIGIREALPPLRARLASSFTERDRKLVREIRRTIDRIEKKTIATSALPRYSEAAPLDIEGRPRASTDPPLLDALPRFVKDEDTGE